MDSQTAQSEIDSEGNKSILKNPINENSEQSSAIKLSPHVKFVDRAQNLPLCTLHEVDKVDYEMDHEEKEKSSCTCALF